MFKTLPPLMRKWFGFKSCPAEEELAAYADRQLIGAERHRIERHIATCDQCLQQIGFLVRSAKSKSEETPQELLSKAVGVGQKTQSKNANLWQWVFASGALAVVAVAALFLNRQPSNVPLQVPTNKAASAPANQIASATQTNTLKAEPDVVRGSSQALTWGLTLPQAGERVDSVNLQFRWQRLSKAAFYELKLVSDAGDIIWEQRTDATFAKLPSRIHLVKGKTYYVWLRAHLVDGRVEQPKAVAFIAG